MARRRDRGFLDGMELLSLRATAPRAAHPVFVAIARTFEQIDRVMLEEIRPDMERREDSQLYKIRCADTQPYKDVRSYIAEIEKGVSHTSSEADVYAYLTDTKCVTAWGWVHSAVLEHQGRSDDSYSLGWVKAKARASEMLDLVQAVLESYDSDECRDLINRGREDIRAGIDTKLRTLCFFNTIYTRPTVADTKSLKVLSSHESYLLFNDFLKGRRENAKARRKERYAKTHRNRDIILVTATVSAIAISVIPLGIAFHTSSLNVHGSTSDADFWLLIQNSLMQGLGLATTALISLVPSLRHPYAWVWSKRLTWTIAVLGLGCALSAAVLYVRVCPIYGAVISFLASAAQACMVLQLALFVDVGDEGEKRD